MKINIVSQLPIPQSGCGDVRFSSNGVNCLLEFEFCKNGADCIAGIQFFDFIAYRFRDEMRSDGYADEAYETLIEISESDWKMQLNKIEPSGINSVNERHHFAVFLSSNGYFEIIAKEFSLVEVKNELNKPTKAT
jgi:hypothetical protein